MTLRINRSICWSVLTCCLTLGGCGGGGGSGNSPGASGATAPSTSSYAGVVTDRNGLGIAGVNITVYIDNDHSEHLTTTDSTGHYSVAGLQAGFPYGQYEIWADKSGYAFMPSIANTEGTVTKTDHNALFKTVIGIDARTAKVISDANFTALRSTDKLIDLPRSGQQVSYISGDDAAAAHGIAWPTTRFIDNHDGTVSDELTGLMWLQDAGCMATHNWNSALAAANQLANGACGLTDGSSAGQWRMPNIGELESLVDVSQSNPALTTGHPFSNVAASYWSSTTYRGDTSEAWVIRFSDGRYINDGSSNVKTSAHALWAVKSASHSGAVALPATGQFIVYATGDDASLLKGVRMPYPRFIDNNNGTLTDTVTGLTWLKRANCIHADWASAIATVNTLANDQCGLVDGSSAGQWRMPNRNEMLTLEDRAETNQALKFNTVFMKANGAVDQALIFDTFTELEYFWTSTTDSSDITQAWTVFSCDYGVYNINKTDIGYTLAVR
jgi:hypothetical protein